MDARVTVTLFGVAGTMMLVGTIFVWPIGAVTALFVVYALYREAIARRP